MTLPVPTEGTVPNATVRVRGVRLPADIAADLIAMSVHQSTELPAMCTLRFWDWDPTLLRLRWSDAPVFEPGAPLEVRVGYVGATARRVFTGEITGIELDMGGDDPPTVTVRCYDLTHRLIRGERTRTFVRMTDSAIARQIASERGLQPVVTETRVSHEHVLQRNETDLDFLAGRAADIGYEVVVDDTQLYFRPRKRKRVARAVLAREDLIDFQVRLTTMGQTGGLVVQARSLPDPAHQLQVRRGPGLATTPGGASRAGTTTTLIRTVDDTAAANAVADGHRGRTDPWRVTGSGSCIGRADLRAGDLVRLAGLGTRFSGDYVVTAAVHTIRAESGYVTSFDVRKDAP
jgi:phage protein D